MSNICDIDFIIKYVSDLGINKYLSLTGEEKSAYAIEIKKFINYLKLKSEEFKKSEDYYFMREEIYDKGYNDGYDKGYEDATEDIYYRKNL